MYYIILSAAVTMFGLQFFFNSRYQSIRGSSAKAALRLLFGSNSAGAIILWAINRFQFEFSWFTLGIALCAGVNLLCYNLCSIRALGKVNLSLFSVYAMLGGMLLPFAQGLLFYNEKMTVGKAVCLILIIAALALSLGKKEKRSGLGYCLGVFFCNGMSGVISKFFSSSPYEKTSEAGYSVLLALIMAIGSGIALLIIKNPPMNRNGKAVGCAVGNGLLNCIANFLLLLSLRKLPASVQYPFVTGGVMIVSTVIAFFTPKKPSSRDMISVAVSFVGLLALVLL